MLQIKYVIAAATVLAALVFGQPSSASVSISDCNFNPLGKTAEQIAGNYRLIPTVVIIGQTPNHDLGSYGVTYKSLKDSVELGLRANGFRMSGPTPDHATVKTTLVLHNVTGTSIYIFTFEIAVERFLVCSGFGDYGLVGPFIVWERTALGNIDAKGLNAHILSLIRKMIDEFSLEFYRAND